MKVAVLSGKGGTGKTFVSVNLASVMKQGTYIDCDVEEPNGHLFFKPVWNKTEEINRLLPKIDMDKCTNCRKCSDFCKFNALANVESKILVFDEVCHSCGGCAMVCPVGAITEEPKRIGQVKTGMSEETKVLTGIMDVKEASGIPIIDRLLNSVPDHENVVIDCPPGSACSVMESIKDADYCVLVAEPTIFGAHNLEMVYELVKIHNKPFGVVLNKTVSEDNPSKEFCINNNVKLLGEFEYDDKLAHLQSKGLIPSREDEEYRKRFLELLSKVYVELAELKFRRKSDEAITCS